MADLPEADTPLSIADSAPATVEIAGAEARIPSQGDLQIAAKIDDHLDISDDNFAVVILYCCLHTDKKSIGRLWQKAWKDPEKLYKDDIVTWMFSIPQTTLQKGLEGISEHLGALNEEQELDADDSEDGDGKKKTQEQ